MLHLPSQNLWILDYELRHYNVQNIYKEVVNVEHWPFPLLTQNTPREFCELYYESIVSNQYNCPRKWTETYGGYWNCNFNIGEVFSELCIAESETPWVSAYEMPWHHVYVLWDQGEDGLGMERFDSVSEYLDKVLLKTTGQFNV